MRVLHVVPTIVRESGGPGRSVPMLCRGLAGAGVDVELYTTNAGPGAADPNDSSEIQRDGYRIRFFPMRWRGHASLSRQLVSEVSATARRFDLVHVHSIWNPTATFSMRAARRARVPYGLTPRGMLDPVVFARHWLRKKAYAWLWEERNVESASFVHFTAAAEEEKARLSGWRLPPTFVVPNAVDASEWEDLPPRSEFDERFPAAKGRRMILFVGRINWVKNLPTLLRAFALVADRDACLVLAGPNLEGHGDELRRLARGLKVEERLVLTGMLEREGLRAAYSAADVFVLPSQKENFGLSAAEAMACGVPVVLSSGVDIASDVVAVDAGIVADTAQDIARAVDSLLDDDGLRKKTGGAAKTMATASFGCEQVGRRMAKVYETILEAGQR